MAKYAEFGSTPLSTDQVTDEAVAASQPSEFTRGARAGTYGMGSSLRNAVGAVADAFDFDNFAAQQYGEADRLSLRAQQSGPRVGSLDQLRQGGYSLRDVGDYAAGVVGGAGPSIALGVGSSLAARGAPLASLAAGTAAFTPFEAGDAVAKFRQANPGQQIDGDTALRLGATGLGSAAFQSVVPAMVGGKIMGRGPASMPATTLRQAVGRNVAEIPLEGATEGAGEFIKQAGATPDLPTDWGQIGENALAGAIGGAPMAGLGAVGDYAHGNARGMADTVGRGMAAARDAVSSATGAARDAAVSTADATQDMARSTWDGVADMAKAAYDGTVEGFKASDLGATLKDRATTVRDWATEIIDDPATPDTIRDALRSAASSAGNKVNQAYVWAAKQVRDAQAAMAKPEADADATQTETPSDVLRSLRTAPDDTVDKVIGDGFLGDAAEMAGATGDRVSELSQESAAKGTEFATKWGNELLNRAGVSDETKAQVAEALRNVGDRASQVTIATAKKAADATESVRTRAKAFADRLAKSAPEGSGTKKSEDYSGARKAVNDVLAKYRQDVPDAVINDPETASMLADGLRQFVQIAARPGAFDTIDKHWTRAQLGSLLGPRSTDILNDVWDAVGSSDPDSVARRYQALNDLDELNKSSSDLVGVLTSALPEGSPLAARQGDDAEVLTRWARGELTKSMSPEQAKFEDRRMREYIQETYGEKSKTVLAALEQRATKTRDLKMDKAPDQSSMADADEVDDGDAVDQFGVGFGFRDAEAPSTSYVGGNKSGKVLVSDPAVYRAKDKTGLEGSTERLIKKLKAENPGADVRFVSITDKPGLVDMIPSLKAKITKEKKALAEQYPGDADRQLAALEQFRDRMVADLKTEGMGMVEVASNPNPDTLTQDEVEAMRLDTERYGKADNPARLEVPDGPIFDAVAVARTMRGKINKERTWTEEDDRSDGHRLARAFSDGVAALMEKYGRFKVSPDTLIGKVDGKDFFARDIKSLPKDAPSGRRGFSLQEDRTAQQLQAELDKLELEAEQREREGDQDLDRLYGRMQRLERDIERASAREGAKDAVEELGMQDVDPANTDIVTAGAALSQRQLQRPPQSGVANDKAPDTKPLIALAERIRESSAPAREKVADRLQTLALNASMMGKKDLQRLMDLKTAEKVSQVAPVINDLARKYADRIVAPKVTPPKAAPQKAAVTPSGQLQKTLDARLEYLNNPPADYTTARAQSIKTWVDGQVERLRAELKGMDSSTEAYEALSDALSTARLVQKKVASVIEGDESLADVEGQPRPKAVAAKKAAFLKKAASGDAALIKELKASTDAKGLQRAAEALNAAELTDANEANIVAAVEAINARLTELVQDPDVAYGMGTKKYSLLSTQVHNDLKRGGFAATHDSPIRHEGKFNWREHTGKGEGNAAFGAGTYLSTGDKVHAFYKKMMSNKTAALRDLVHAVIGTGPVTAEGKAYALEEARNKVAEYKRLLGESVYPPDAQEYRQGIEEWSQIERQISRAKIGVPFDMETKSPTYHVSVGVMKAQLLNWDKPLNEQSSYVKKRLEGVDTGVGLGVWEEQWNYYGAAVSDGSSVNIEDEDGAGENFIVSHGKVKVGSFTALTEAMAGVDEYLAGKGLQLVGAQTGAQTGADIYRALTTKLGSQAAASDYLQSLGILGHEYAASNGRDGTTPNYVIYDDSKIETNYVHFSAQRAAGAGMSPKGQRQVLDAINTMLGNSVKVELTNLPHAGEFEQVGADDVIRVSVHALNPTTVAYHESLHALFAKLMREGSGDVADVLMRATQRPAVNKRLRELLAGEPAALRQLRDPEERAAYMFQFWADGDAQLIAALKGQPQTLLQRIADTLRRVLGIWSNEDRALHIMEAFSGGEFAQNLGNPGAFRRAVMAPGRNKAVEAARSLTKPFTELGEAVVAAGSARLRDSRIPSLVELADTVKAPLTEETADPGYLPAARLERTRVLNDLGAKLADLPKETIAEALEILQTGGMQGSTPEARLAAREVRKVLADQLAYLRAAGVDVKDLGPDYFPRVYDATYISKHQTEFQAVLDKYGVQGDTMHKIIANGGTELGIEVDRPGLQAKKARKLDMIPDAELAPFMQKDLYQILNSYVTQATRRAEWARRFGDDSSRLHAMLAKAKNEGATDAQVEAAEKYVRGVNGTLGDDINPTARRLMGDMIVYQNIRLLPLAIFSSVVDPMGVLVRGGEVKDAWNTFKRGIREIPKGLRGDTSLDESARIADTLGVIDNAALVHDLGALYSQGMVGNTARKINDAFFRFNLMEQFNRSMRVGATEAALKFMERHAAGTASAHSARWMRELGLMRGDVQVVNGRVALTQADGLTAAQEVRIRTAVNRWVDGAVLRPDAADKPIWMNDPHWALVAHLKQFVYAFHHTILKRVGHEMRNGNYAPAMALASYVPIMIAADAAKGMLQNGGDEPEWKKNWGLEDYVAHGVQRAGLLGVGQLGVDAYTDVQRGGTGVGALAGPTLEQLGDAMQVLGGNKQFESFALRAMPANALYSGYLNEERADLSTD